MEEAMSQGDDDQDSGQDTSGSTGIFTLPEITITGSPSAADSDSQDSDPQQMTSSLAAVAVAPAVGFWGAVGAGAVEGAEDGAAVGVFADGVGAIPGAVIGAVIGAGVVIAGGILMSSDSGVDGDSDVLEHPDEADAQDVAEDLDATCDEIVPAIEKLIEEIVGRYNDLLAHDGGDKGHRDFFEKMQRLLRSLMDKAINNGCPGYDSDLQESAGTWSGKPLPTKS
jgi:hypothetical protein